MPDFRLPLVRSTFALLLVGLFALLGIVGTTYWLGQRSQDYFASVIEAREQRVVAVDLRDAVQTAESSQRGFMVSGNEIYLAPYDTAKTTAERQVLALRRVLGPYPDVAPSVDRLAQAVREKFDEMDRIIALKRARRDAEALAIMQTNRGKLLMDEANLFVSGIIRRADDKLTSGIEEQQRNAAFFRWVSILGSMVVVLMVSLAAYAALRYTRELTRARDEVTLLNTGLEERVRARTADLARANQEIQRFAYIVTHDLRAPLVNIMGFTSELETGLATLRNVVDRPDAIGNADDPDLRAAQLAAAEDLPEAIGFIRSSTRKMDNLINAILRLSREGRRELRPERIDLADLVEASAAAVRHQLSDAEGTISVDIAMPAIVSDRLSLEQIFGNLLDNAVKYRSKKRPLRIAVTARPATGLGVEIDIADNGRGIAEQDAERVFELFRRAGPQDQPGEGIGLPQVRTLIRNLGGEITMSSALDEGTTFRLVLPRYLPATERPAS